MTRNEAKDYVKTQEPNFLRRAKTISGKPSYVCPECGNGTGKDGTGIVKNPDGRKYTCFKCGLSEDVIGLWGRHTGTAGKEMFDSLYSHYGIQVDGQADGGTEYQKGYKTEQKTAPEERRTAAPEEKETDYSAFLLRANKDLDKTDYHRGISMDTLNRFGVGYVAEWRHPKVSPQVPTSPRLVIPTSKYSYIARDTRANIPEDQRQYAKSKVGKTRFFNEKAVWNSKQPIFVTEGEIDALSVIDLGAEAIALGSAAYWRKLPEMIKRRKPAQPLILALDNDDTGKESEELLANALRSADVSFYRQNITGNYKDANERLTADKDGLTAAVFEALKNVAKLEEQKKEEERATYVAEESAAGYLQGFIDGIADSVNTPSIPTGFLSLDKTLGGGLYEGLYILGAVSSLGKTTLVMQIGDQIAERGEDVLIFSLEMARTELMAKSISRLTLLGTQQNNGDVRNAKTARGITAGERYKNYNEAEKELIQRSTEAYGRYAEHIFIQEGIGDIGAEQIRESAKTHISITGKTPVVIVDYLQILAPTEPRATDKQNTDRAVMELKRISRDFKLPVIAVSALNRENYGRKISMTAFKESGAIEYSSDVLIGLQFKGVGGDDFDITTAMRKDPREVEAYILKNRNGKTGDKVDLKYYPLFNYFTED